MHIWEIGLGRLSSLRREPPLLDRRARVQRHPSQNWFFDHVDRPLTRPSWRVSKWQQSENLGGGAIIGSVECKTNSLSSFGVITRRCHFAPTKQFHFSASAGTLELLLNSGEKGGTCPPAIRYALIKFRQSAYLGRNSRANVVFPAGIRSRDDIDISPSLRIPEPTSATTVASKLAHLRTSGASDVCSGRLHLSLTKTQPFRSSRCNNPEQPCHFLAAFCPVPRR